MSETRPGSSAGAGCRPPLLAGLALGLLASGCAARGGEPPGPGCLADRVVVAGARAPVEGVALYRDFDLVRCGRREAALVLVAPVRARAPLVERGALRLEGWCTPVFNIGDGVELEVSLVRGQARTPLLRRTFDAGRRAADRDWVRIEVPLDVGAADASWLELELRAGPQGDLVGDWLALADLRLVAR